MHLIVDGIARNRELLASVSALARWLMELVLSIEMRPIGVPYVLEYPGSNGSGPGHEPGLSGVLFLAESSITVHTWPESGLVTLDIYSCKAFDSKKVLEEVLAIFGIEKYGFDLLMRPMIMDREVERVGKEG